MTRSESKRKFSVFEFGEDEKRAEEEAGMLAGKYTVFNNFSHASKLSRSSSLPRFLSKSPVSDQFDKRSRKQDIFITLDEAVDIDEQSDSRTATKSQAFDITPIWISPVIPSPKSDSSIPTDVIDLSTSSMLENGASGIDSDCIELDGLIAKEDTMNTDASKEVSVSFQDEEFQAGDTQSESGLKGTRIILYPDVILYQDTVFEESCSVTFSKSCVQLHGNAVAKTTRNIDAEFAVNDILLIECEWCASVKTVKIIIQLRPDTRNEDSIEFFVTCPFWAKERDEIQSLNILYQKAWKETRIELNFDDVIYPIGDPDAVTITCTDAELLKPHRYLNDTVIDFYIKYLKNKIPSEQQHCFHFFNSFFFRKLAGLCNNLVERKTSLYKWTKNVDLFEKNYIFIPVNFSFHWSLIVICHPGKCVDFKEEKDEFYHRQPCILHMDSMRGSHYGLMSLMRRHPNADEATCSKFSNFNFVSLELPQQENSFDCGIFLLEYVELFLHDIVSNSESMSANFLKNDWFDPKAVSSKRTEILRLIYRISKFTSTEMF